MDKDSAEESIEQILNKPAWRHLASGDYWACDVCSAMGKCSCKIKDMKAEKIAEAIASELKKDYAKKN